jgi:hypothetical protein
VKHTKHACSFEGTSNACWHSLHPIFNVTQVAFQRREALIASNYVYLHYLSYAGGIHIRQPYGATLALISRFPSTTQRYRALTHFYLQTMISKASWMLWR